MKSYSIRKGFTLIEILIVVIILGILAAIVIPQFTNASEEARRSSLASQLQTLRSQVELYKLQHLDDWPTNDGTQDAAKWTWGSLTGLTTVTVNGESKTYGPYLQNLPLNPLTNSTSVVADNPTDTAGYVLTDDGRIFAAGKGGTWFNDTTQKDQSTQPAQ